VARAAPILHAWAGQGHQSLREITRQDILGALPAQANQHRQALTALRSLFRFLKGRRVIFADPAARVRHDRLHNGQPLPVNLDTVREAIHSGQPARAALAALVAFHALRSGQLASLKLTDVRDGRPHLDRRVILLAGPVRERLAAWLDYRACRWPATVNPHLFINWYTAVRESPVSSPWVAHALGISPQAVREDRILHEALATGGDIRRRCDLFGPPSAAPSATPALPKPAGRATKSHAVSGQGTENWPFAGTQGTMPGRRPRRPERCGMPWFEVPEMLGSLAGGRSACRTPSWPRPAPAAAVRTRAAGSRCRYDLSLPSQAIRARGSIAARDMA
jgi:hypothetical protein